MVDNADKLRVIKIIAAWKIIFSTFSEIRTITTLDDRLLLEDKVLVF